LQRRFRSSSNIRHSRMPCSRLPAYCQWLPIARLTQQQQAAVTPQQSLQRQ
jgi:hypothetical protein